jgi:TolB-like protein
MLPHLQRLNVLLAELKRRQVFRAAAVYAVVAWGVIEVTATVLPIFLLPEWMVRAVAVVMVLGFPAVLSLAWAFDLTPQGVQRTGEAEESLPGAGVFLKSLRFRATLALLVLVATIGAGWVSWQVWLKPGAVRGPGTEAEAGRGKLDPASLAVLYFDDFSADGELAYLANGVTEALIHELSQVEALGVVSRNGVKPYRELTIPLDSLAKVLGVGSIVEGSVEGTGDRIIVSVQLINGETGMSRFSQRIEGRGEDVLALRDTIVQQAVRLVGRRLGREMEQRRVRARSSSPAAWDLYLRAQHLVEDADTLLWVLHDTVSARSTLLRADSLYAIALEEDPEWPTPLVARGWSARTRAGLFSTSQTNRDRDLLEFGLEMAEAALRLDEGNAEALELRGSLGVDLFRRSDTGDDPELARAAENDLRTAAAADETRVFAWVALADLLRQQGKFQEASIAAQHALDADPFLINAEKEVLFVLSQVFLELGAVEEAVRWIDEGRKRFPSEPSFPAAKLVLMAGRTDGPSAVDSAHLILCQIEEMVGIPQWSYGRLQVAATLAQHSMADSAEAFVKQVREGGSDDPWLDYYEANMRIRMGQVTTALELLESFLEVVPQRRAYIARDWWWEALREDPRFQVLVGTGLE